MLWKATISLKLVAKLLQNKTINLKFFPIIETSLKIKIKY